VCVYALCVTCIHSFVYNIVQSELVSAHMCCMHTACALAVVLQFTGAYSVHVIYVVLCVLLDTLYFAYTTSPSSLHMQ
jgi:hypothetical protein